LPTVRETVLFDLENDLRTVGHGTRDSRIWANYYALIEFQSRIFESLRIHKYRPCEPSAEIVIESPS
jgi:hypothetical protein